MANPRNFLESEFVHVTQRGIGRRLIFEDDEDRRRFLDTLGRKSQAVDVDMLAWCLMDNHFHLLVRSSPADMSRLMQATLISYAQYFNGRHGHVGKVFQNRFHSQALVEEAHLLATVRYIHRNCMDLGVEDPADYRWSSYRECAGNEDVEGRGLCDVGAIVSYFGDSHGFVGFHGADALDEEVIGFIPYKPRIDDGEARAIVVDQVGSDYCGLLAGQPKDERDRHLRALKLKGLSVRQIERLTGIGRSIVTRA